MCSLFDNSSESDKMKAAIKIKLTDEELKALEEPYSPQAIIGHT